MEEEIEKVRKKKEEYTVRIGPLLKRILDEQMEIIKDATYDVCDTSYWEAGEVIAKKINLKNQW